MFFHFSELSFLLNAAVGSGFDNGCCVRQIHPQKEQEARSTWQQDHHLFWRKKQHIYLPLAEENVLLELKLPVQGR
jgi:hypothetical protein